ncbi:MULTISPECIES: arsenate reductase ArsC [unclassified Pseudomonas]|uniref:arsenate reductase ArsC n=1 Tax=unclassified Pseudomonas TaxID=196821 RepID=UPI002449CBA2|nr:MULTISPECIES: arsenate reductase ArsC [unclassified Pseudomonas]MDH0301689.1 arsenate reductase ArsC [Pseudomonas sp. GD04091]MDH1984908.1 arsenate reductase ArsC [Pseudomonas sp. GD03689]
MSQRLRVLFVCIGNDARSLIAEAVLRHADPEHFEAFSGGVTPAPVDPRTLAVLEHAGISTAGLHSKPLEDFTGKSFDYLIDLCDKQSDELAQLPHSSETIAWSFANPVGTEGDEGFRHLLQQLSDRIKLFLMVKNRPHPHSDKQR